MKYRNFISAVLLLTLILTQLVFPHNAKSVSCTWTGGASTDWSASGNWSGCQGAGGNDPPQSTDTVTIADVTNDPVIAANVTIAGLSLSTNGALTINSGATLVVNGNLSMGANGGTTATVANTGTVEIAGTAAFSRSDASGTGNFSLSGSGTWTFVGAITQNTSTRITLGSGNYYLKGNLSRSGTFEPGTSTITFNSGSTQSISGDVQHHFYNLTVSNNTTLSHASGSVAVNIRNNFAVDTGSTFSQSGSASGREVVFVYAVSYSVSTLSGGGAFTFARVTIDANKTVNAGNTSITIGATTGTSSPWANSGTFNGQTGTVTFNNSTTAALTGGTNNFNNLVVANRIDFGSANVSLAGNWTNNGTFTAGTGKVTFNGSGTSTISGVSATTFYTLEISSNTTLDVGTNTLFDATNSVRNYGKLKQTQTVGTDNAAFLNLSSGKYYGVEVDPSDATGMGSTTVTIYGEQTCPTPPSLGVTTIKRCFDIAPATATTATVKFWYDATNELNTNTQGSVKAYYQEGGLWHEATGAYTRASGTFNSVEVTGVSVFSRFALTSNTPSESNLITLARFAAAPAVGGGITVVWETASEIDTAGYHLWRSDRSQDGYARITAALLPARGGPTRCATYTFTDRAALPGRTYHYRLEEVDIYGLSAFHGPTGPVIGLAQGPIFRAFLPVVGRPASFP